ncbi:MAG: DUF1848 domain-containing protein [Rhodospirillales bacterium]|nr:DUF1848 domain-containing protein [Rhodospirillales bacterium]
MIVSASYKTDIPAFYGNWFLNRLEAGYCRVLNPYGGKPFTVSLRPADVDGFVFWTRNLAPFLDALEIVGDRNLPFAVQYTITGYPRLLDAATAAPERTVADLRMLAGRYGRRCGVWRYDPILFTSLTPADWHRDNFARLALDLSGIVDEAVISFAQIYRKTAGNLNAAARLSRFDWWDPEPGEKKALMAEMAAIAADHRMKLTLCGQPELLIPGVDDANCIDSIRLSDIAGRAITAPRRAHRKTCACHASRDIGDYDTCPHGCVYCYAVRTRALAKRRFAAHDPKGEFLFPPAQIPAPIEQNRSPELPF